MDDKDLERCLYDWPPPWIPGRPKPPRVHTKYRKAKERALGKVHPVVRPTHCKNKLWNRLVNEHNADIDFWLYDDEPHPRDTREWKFLENTLLPKILMALENSCKLQQSLKVSEERIFSFSDSFAHFLCNNVLEEEPVKTEDQDIKRTPEAVEKRYEEEFIPKYKLMSYNKAVKTIQKYVRGWLVRKRPEVQEIRDFWKIMRESAYQEVVRTDSTVLRRRMADYKCPVQSDFFVDPDVLRRLLGEDMYKEDKEFTVRISRPSAAEEGEESECAAALGLGREVLARLGEENLEELIRICSMQEELRQDAVAAFFRERGLQELLGE